MPFLRGESAPHLFNWQQMHPPNEPKTPDYLSIRTEIDQLGYRYCAKEIFGRFEYASPWHFPYSKFLLERCLFLLSCKMAEQQQQPAIVLDLAIDTIADFNFKFKQKLKLCKRSPLPAPDVWASSEAYQGFKASLSSGGQQHLHLRTTEEEILHFAATSELYTCPQVGGSFALIQLRLIEEVSL